MREGSEMDEEKGQKGRRRLPPWLILGFALIAVLLFVPLLRGGSGEKTEEVSLQTFAQEVEAGEAERIVIKGDKLTLEREDGTEVQSRKEEGISAIETLPF